MVKLAVFTDAQFEIVMVMVFFLFFLAIGYFSEKKSGGVFMLLSGFILSDLAYLLTVTYNWIFLVFLLPTGIFLMILGIMKWLVVGEPKESGD